MTSYIKQKIKEEKALRLQQALRENLKKRKEQMRQRAQKDQIKEKINQESPKSSS